MNVQINVDAQFQEIGKTEIAIIEATPLLLYNKCKKESIKIYYKDI